MKYIGTYFEKRWLVRYVVNTKYTIYLYHKILLIRNKGHIMTLIEILVVNASFQP